MGGGSSNPTDNEANNPIPCPEPTPTPEPEPEPAPAPEPEPTPAPTVYFTVTFDSQGGSSVPSQRVKSGKTVTKPVDPTRDGHTFTGWYKSANGTTQFKFGSDGDKITRDITLYAKWSEVPKPETYYTVTFDSNGGSSVPSQRVIAGGTVTRPADPVKEGYTFNGWFFASKQFKFGNGGDKVTGDITLVAGWMIINYTVTFDSRGGSSVPNQSVSYGGTISKPYDPVRNGYTFVGWYKDSTLTEAFRFGSGGDKVTSNLTLYAKWSMSDSSRADIAVQKISIGYQDGDSSEHVTGNIILPYNVDVSGNLVNIVWTSNKPDVISTNGIVNRQSSNVTVRLTATVTVGNVKRSVIFDITVISIVPEPEPTPIPTPEPIPSEPHTILFDSKGGTLIATSTVQFGDVTQEPDEPTREGYTFAGWYDSDGYIFEFGLPISKDITLTADWAEVFEPSTIEEAQGMAEIYEALEDVEISGIVSVSFDNDGTSPIMSLDVIYTLDDVGVLDIREVESGPLTKTAGLVGSPVDISVVGDGQVISAEIVFRLSPSHTNKDDFGIVWYDESNDIVVSLDSKVIGDTVRASVTHFSQYAVVKLSTWEEVWNTILPAIHTDKNLDIIMLLDLDGYDWTKKLLTTQYATNYKRTIEAAKNLLTH